jgi:hypothetical protein
VRWNMYGVQGRSRSVPGVFDRVSAEEAWEVRGILGLLFLSVVSIYPRDECKLTASDGERDRTGVDRANLPPRHSTSSDILGHPDRALTQ